MKRCRWVRKKTPQEHIPYTTFKPATSVEFRNGTDTHWQEIFNNDSTLTAALLDRLLYHVETIVIEGRSYRTKDQITTP